MTAPPPCSCSGSSHSLSLAQEGIWFTYVNTERPAFLRGCSNGNKQDPKEFAFHLGLEYRWNMSLNVYPSRLDELMRDIISSHPMLRATFSPNFLTEARIHTMECNLVQHSCNVAGKSETFTSNAILHTPMDLCGALPWRIQLDMDVTCQELSLTMVVHHLVCDGYSLPLLHTAILAAFPSLVDEEEAEPTTEITPRLPLPFHIRSSDSSAEFWREHVAGANFDFRLLSDRLETSLDDTPQPNKNVINIPVDNSILLDVAAWEATSTAECKRTAFSLCAASFWQVLQHMAGPQIDEAAPMPLGVSFLARPTVAPLPIEGVNQYSNALPVVFRPSPYLAKNRGDDIAVQFGRLIQQCKVHEGYDSVQLARDLRRSTGLFRNGITILPPFPFPLWMQSFQVHLFTEDDLMLVVVRGASRSQWSLRLLYNTNLYTHSWAQRLAQLIVRQLAITMARCKRSPASIADPTASSTSASVPGISSPRRPRSPRPTIATAKRFPVHPLADTAGSVMRLLGPALQSRVDWSSMQLNLWEMIWQAATCLGSMAQEHSAIVQACTTTGNDKTGGGENSARRSLSYTGLLDRVAVISDCLEQRLAAVPRREDEASIDSDVCQEVVAILGRKASVETILAMLAVMQSGHIYMCLDVETLDVGRMRHMLSDSTAVCVIQCVEDMPVEMDGIGRGLARILVLPSATHSQNEWICAWEDELLSSGGPTAPVLALPSQRRRILSRRWAMGGALRTELPPGLVYLKYTSGTTGKPKGVLMTHAGVCSMLIATQTDVNVSRHDRVLLFSSISFDASVWQIFAALAFGATLVLPDDDILASIASESISVLDTVPSLLNEMHPSEYPSLRAVQLGAEACPLHLAQTWTNWSDAHPQQQLRLLNSYGPTEAAVITHACRLTSSTVTQRVSIGRGIANMRTYVLNDKRELIAEGAIGHIWVAGIGVSPTGYLNRPELNRESFLQNSFALAEGLDSAFSFAPVLYKTGDIGRWIGDDGLLECLGRVDHQVKWHGCRVELNQIEHVTLQFKAELGITECVAVLCTRDKFPDQLSQDCLVLYVTPTSGVEETVIRTVLRTHLAPYMQPSHIMLLEQFPRNSSDKIDRHSLPLPVATSTAPTVDDENSCSTSALDEKLQPQSRQVSLVLRQIWNEIIPSSQTIISTQQLHFFDIGGTSLHLLVLLNRIKKQWTYASSLGLVELFSLPLFDQQVNRICSHQPLDTDTIVPQQAITPMHEICTCNDSSIDILACEGFFPVGNGSSVGMDELWNWIVARRVVSNNQEHNATTHFVVDPQHQERRFIHAFGSLPSQLWELFPHESFQISRKEALLMDPQQRLLIECTFQALLNSGLETKQTRIGTFVAISESTYPTTDRTDSSDTESVKQRYQRVSNNLSATAATRLAFTFDLRGPAVSIQTACSSFGAAMAMALQSIRSGECDAAVVAASSIRFPQTGHEYEEGMIFSASGQCRPFEQRSDGITIGNACGAVVISRRALGIPPPVDQAELLSAHINNDGRSDDKAGFTAPSSRGECEVMAKALLSAGVTRLDQLAFVEAHGTGTALGDPVEFHSVAQVMKSLTRSDSTPNTVVPLSAVKGNLGHCDTAAGFAGLSKALLCLEYRRLPGQPEFERLNKLIDEGDRNQLSVSSALTPLACSETHQNTVLINGFGIGGSNTSLVIRRVHSENHSQASEKSIWVCPVRHQSRAALEKWTDILSKWAQGKSKQELTRAHTTLIRRWNRHTHILPRFIQERLAAVQGVIVIDSSTSPSPLLRLWTSNLPIRREVSATTVVLCFTGQGSFNASHAVHLMKHSSAYAESVQVCRSVVQTLCSQYAWIADLVLPFEWAANNTDDTAIEWWNNLMVACTSTLQTNELMVQWSAFVHSVSTYRDIRAHMDSLEESSASTQPAHFLGHSLGEFAARHCKGELSLVHAFFLIAARSYVIGKSAPGRMVVVGCTTAEEQVQLQFYISSLALSSLSIAAVNHSTQLVISGSGTDIEGFTHYCEERKWKTHLMKGRSAYHSKLLQTAWDLESDWLTRRKIEFESCAEHTPSTGDVERGLWEWMHTHLVGTVQFHETVKDVLNASAQPRCTLWIEVGDAPILIRFVKSITAASSNSHAFLSLWPSTTEVAESAFPTLQTWSTVHVRAQLAAHLNRIEILSEGFEESCPTIRLPPFPLSPPDNPLVQTQQQQQPKPLSPTQSSRPPIHALRRTHTRQVSFTQPHPTTTPTSPPTPPSARKHDDKAYRRRTWTTLLHDDVRTLFFQVLGMVVDSEQQSLWSDADFIQLGGDSMTALELMARFRKLVPGSTLTASAFLSKPYLRTLLGELISRSSAGPSPSQTLPLQLTDGGQSRVSSLPSMPLPSPKTDMNMLHDQGGRRVRLIVWLVPPVGGSLFLYADWLVALRALPGSDMVVQGLSYQEECGVSVESISKWYTAQASCALRQLQSRLRGVDQCRLVVLGLSYGGLVAQHMFRELSNGVPDLILSFPGEDTTNATQWKTQLVLIDTPTPETLTERRYRNRSDFTSFDSFKYTFADMFEQQLPEAKLDSIQTERQLAELVRQELHVEANGYEDLAKQAMIYRQDVQAIRQYKLGPGVSRGIPTATGIAPNGTNDFFTILLFVCREPRAMDPRGHAASWSAFCQTAAIPLQVIETPGDHISMNKEPILSAHLIPALFTQKHENALFALSPFTRNFMKFP